MARGNPTGWWIAVGGVCRSVRCPGCPTAGRGCRGAETRRVSRFLLSVAIGPSVVLYQGNLPRL
jgi:hypothetical protein